MQKKEGYISQHKKQIPMVPYFVSAFTYNKKGKILIYSLEKIFAFENDLSELDFFDGLK